MTNITALEEIKNALEFYAHGSIGMDRWKNRLDDQDDLGGGIKAKEALELLNTHIANRTTTEQAVRIHELEATINLLNEVIIDKNKVEEVPTPAELADQLSFHFTEDQANDIAQHVYQPFLRLIKSHTEV